MSQYRIGAVTATNGSATITGAGTSWLAEVSPNDLFIVSGESIPVGDKVLYTVASVTDDTTIQLSAPYVGTTYAGQTYVIHRDFAPNGMPLFQQGDLETVYIINEWAKKAITGGDLGTAAYLDAQTSLTDATANRVMLTGAFGLGATDDGEPIPNNDANDIISTGLYKVDGGTLNTIGAGNMLHITRNSTTGGTRATQVNFAGDGKVYYRVNNSGSWGGYQEFYTTANYQPSNSLGTNVVVELINNSGGSLANQATVAGSSLQTYVADSSGNKTVKDVAAGTYRNVNKSTIANGESGKFNKEA